MQSITSNIIAIYLNWEKAVERLQKFWTDQLAVKDIPGFELYTFTVFLSGD